MRTAIELVNDINEAKINTPHNVEDVIDMEGVSEITQVNFDEHRWYTIATVVYSVGDEYFGVRGPVSLKSESSDWDDIGATCEAFLMEPVPSITYRRKSEGSGK